MMILTLAHLTIRLDGHILRLAPDAILTVTDTQAQRLLARAPGKVRLITLPPEPVGLDGPLAPLRHWLVSYRNPRGMLCGGCDDRQHGTVEECRWTAGGWTVHLTDGQQLPLTIIRGVTKPDGTAWTVREHGYDGEGPVDGRRGSKTEDKQREGASE
jgi:hypothetical protein